MTSRAPTHAVIWWMAAAAGALTKCALVGPYAVNERPSSSLLCIYAGERSARLGRAANVATRSLGGRTVFCRTRRLRAGFLLLTEENNTLPTHSYWHAMSAENHEHRIRPLGHCDSSSSFLCSFSPYPLYSAFLYVLLGCRVACTPFLFRCFCHFSTNKRVHSTQAPPCCFKSSSSNRGILFFQLCS